MKEYPILFKGEMVREILECRKTMTRRIPDCRNAKWQISDRLWIKETFADWKDCLSREHCRLACNNFHYKATSYCGYSGKWKSSLFMHRSKSRILLEITAIREEYLQNITEEDAIKEGIRPCDANGYYNY